MAQPQQKTLVIDAINDLKLRVTPADVATKTGLPILVATAELNKIASDTKGHLQVSDKGDVVYKFDPGFQTAYLTQGFMRVVEQIGKKCLDIAYYLLRISFGIMLIVSFLLVVVLIFVAVLALMKGNDRDGGGEGGGFDFDFIDFLIFRDLLYWGTWATYERPYYFDPYSQPSTRIPQKNNFLLNCFSFLFGDGNPNLHLDERKWQMIAQLINKNKGAVTAEQLAPYTGVDPKNEDGVLPVLVRYNGRPEVTESGNIIYVFPELQVHATKSSDGLVPAYLREWRWDFTSVPGEALIPVYLLAGVTFLGSWWLCFEQARILLLHSFAPLIAALTIYGTLFLTVPLVRYGVLRMINGRIESRNERRQAYAATLAARPPELENKLREASNYSITERHVGSDQIVYTTERDVLEQEFEHGPDKSV